MNEKLALVREFPTVAPDQDVVDAVEAILKLAKDGELRGMVWCGALRDGSHTVQGFGTYINLHHLVGSIEILKHEVISRRAPEGVLNVTISDPPEAT